VSNSFVDFFTGRGYVVTGAASGIGLATARLLKDNGARLVLWDTNAEALAQVGITLDAHTVTVDVSHTGQVISAAAEASAILGKIDGVVHAAGILHTGSFSQVDLEKHLLTVRVNLNGTLIVAYSVLPYLKPLRGSLILMGSASAFYGVPEYASYGASKAGVLNFAQALRLELDGMGVHIGVVSPHNVDTPMLDQYNRRTKVVKRFGMVHSADSVAQAILRGIVRRQSMIWPGIQPRLLFWAMRFFSPPIVHMATRLILR
jgi:short-subunit dehydrogenase